MGRASFASSDEDCEQSQKCKAEGACSVDQSGWGQCVPSSDVDCLDPCNKSFGASPVLLAPYDDPRHAELFGAWQGRLVNRVLAPHLKIFVTMPD